MKTINIFFTILLFSAVCFAGTMPNSIYNDDGTITAHAYIQDGLINMWDAKENIGFGLHSDDTTIWKDLVGNRDMALSGLYHWSNDAWYVKSVHGQGLGTIPEERMPDSQTFQLVIHPTNMYPETSTSWKVARIMTTHNPNAKIYVYRNSNGNAYHFSWSAYEDDTTRAFADVGGTNAFSVYDLHQHTLMHEADSPVIKYYIDGDAKKFYTSSSEALNNGTNNNSIWFANNEGLTAGIDASFNCIRFYDRTLSSEELAWNYMIDSIRYELPRKYYPYAASSWCWIDFTDKNVLRTDTDASVLAEIGDEVLRIKNKGGWTSTTWQSSGVERTEDGVRPMYTNSTGQGTNCFIKGVTTTMFKTNSDWNNIEFSTIIVTKNEQASTYGGTVYFIRPSYWQPLAIYCSGSSFYYRSMQTVSSGNKIQGITHARLRQIDPLIISARVKAVNGEFNIKIAINGTIVVDQNGTVPDGFGYNFIPGISLSKSYELAARDYCENIWWDHIPEDWDKIEQTLILKYNAKPLTYYIPNYGQPLLGGGFGGVYTGGDTEEPEEFEELSDEEVEELEESEEPEETFN